MSSACVCHTDQWCFYCEMYTPLERKYENQTRAIEKMLIQLFNERSKLRMNVSLHAKIEYAYQDKGKHDGLTKAIELLEAVIEREANSPHSPNGCGEDDRARQIRQRTR